MNTHFSEKQLVGIFCILFAVSALFLFWQNKRELNPNFEKSWWTLSFAEAKNENSLAFTITNHTDRSEFTYETSYAVTPGTVTTSRSTIIVAPGEMKTIIPDFVRNPDSRTTITVTAGTEKQEIYR
jgi:hypothetical protein